MANITAGRAFNQYTDVVLDLTQNATIVTSSLIVSPTSVGTSQHFGGSFDYLGEQLSGGVLTNFSHFLSDGSLWWQLEGVNQPVADILSYYLANNSLGFQSIAFQGNDGINGSAENDSLLGFGGNDVIYANSGNDTVNGNQGADFINGNQGNDNIEGGKDNDHVEGGKDNDTVNGNFGNDYVNGNFGNDLVRGGKDDDTVRGGQGDDQVMGDLGNDILYGDKGNDTLTGGSGTDVFVMSPGGGNDVVTDFEDGIDKVHVSGFGIGSFDQLTVTDAGVGAQISFAGGESITLTGIITAAVDAGDFIFS